MCDFFVTQRTIFRIPLFILHHHIPRLDIQSLALLSVTNLQSLELSSKERSLITDIISCRPPLLCKSLLAYYFGFPSPYYTAPLLYVESFIVHNTIVSP